MKKKYRTGPNLFFIEFIIALFFFLIVSTICVRVFVHAHLVTLGAEALSYAQTTASSVAEVIKESRGDDQKLLDAFPDMHKSDGCFLLSCDKNFQFCRPEEASYTLTVKPSHEEQLNTAQITVTDSRQQVIYQLSVQFHSPLTREEVLS